MQRRMARAKDRARHEIGQHHIAPDRHLPTAAKAHALGRFDQKGDKDPDRHRPKRAPKNSGKRRQSLTPRHGPALQHQCLPELFADKGDKQGHHQMRDNQHGRQRHGQGGQPARQVKIHQPPFQRVVVAGR